MAAVLTGLCDAVKTDLNSVTWSPAFTAIRQNVPRAKREDMSSVRVTVTPQAKRIVGKMRDRTSYNLTVYVLIQKGLTSDDDSETDPLVALGELIADRYNANKVLTVGSLSAPCTEAVFGADDDSAFMVRQSQNEGLQYGGIVALTFMVHQ